MFMHRISFLAMAGGRAGMESFPFRVVYPRPLHSGQSSLLNLVSEVLQTPKFCVIPFWSSVLLACPVFVYPSFGDLKFLLGKAIPSHRQPVWFATL